MAVIHRRAAARRELLDHFDYLEQHAGVEIAVRFLAAAQSTFDQLATMPRMAPSCNFIDPALRKLRRWPVKDFDNWLIFYQPTRDGIEIVRVLHGARDITSILEP